MPRCRFLFLPFALLLFRPLKRNGFTLPVIAVWLLAMHFLDMVSIIRPMVYVSLTIDHRVLDGFQTNAFLTEFCRTLENWS